MKKFAIVLFAFLIIIPVSAHTQVVNKKLLIINGTAESLSGVDLSSGQITHTESNVFGITPNDIKVHNGKGYIINSGSADISVINLETYLVEKTISLPEGSNPWTMEFTGVNEAYVSSFVYNNIYVVNISEGSLIDSISVGDHPEGMLRVGTTVYVANTAYNPVTYGYGQGTVSVIDITTREVTATVNVPMNPQELALGPNGKIYILSTGNYFSDFGKIAVLETLYPEPGYLPTPTITDSITIGGSPGDIEITSAGKEIYFRGRRMEQRYKGICIYSRY